MCQDIFLRDFHHYLNIVILTEILRDFISSDTVNLIFKIVLFWIINPYPYFLSRRLRNQWVLSYSACHLPNKHKKRIFYQIKYVCSKWSPEPYLMITLVLTHIHDNFQIIPPSDFRQFFPKMSISSSCLPIKFFFGYDVAFTFVPRRGHK